MASAPRYGSARQAAAYRDRLLGRTRAISLGIASGALAACIGFGVNFAQALPGHARPAVAGHRPPRAGPATGSWRAPAGHRPGKHAPRPLSPPSQPPASTPAPPQTTSGGS